MDAFPSSVEMVLRAFFAVLGAAALGWQRERHGKPAGLRTQMMVGLGAAMFTLATLKLYEAALDAGVPGRLDPLRVIEGVVGGIGFLGAGTIIQARGSVKGITTAATIWVVGAFGIACGLGYYFLAGVNVVFAMVILSGVGFLEKRLIRDDDGSDSSAERQAVHDRSTTGTGG
jgi:putative Mg2+ transporter-C (MgtC) family protein